MKSVIVIGAGPAGQTAALLLARWGVPVVVLDQRPARDPIGSKALCQQGDVLDVWSAVGADSIAEEGLTWTTARTYYQERELFSWSFQVPGLLPPFVNISQARTEEILDARIAAEPLIEVRWGHEVTGLVQDDDGVSVLCGDREIRASYVIACAGSRGQAVREMLGVAFEGRTFDDQFLICDIKTDLPGWQDERRFYFDPEWNPGRQVLIHPCPDSTFRIDWQVPPDFDLEEERAAGGLDHRIRQIIGTAPYELIWCSIYRFHARAASRMRVGRVLLAGDCAHLVAPFGARGLNSGVPDVENAAWKVAFVLNGWAPEELLETYHLERHAAALENLEVTSATMRFLVPEDEQEWVRRRELLERGVAEDINSGRFAEPFWYVDSPLSTPEPSRPFNGRPPIGESPPPAPGVIVPDALIRGGRFREICRDGLLVLLAHGLERSSFEDSLPGRVSVRELAEIDETGALAETLGIRPGEAWIIRPDAHIAAILPDARPGAVTAAARRAVGSHV